MRIISEFQSQILKNNYQQKYKKYRSVDSESNVSYRRSDKYDYRDSSYEKIKSHSYSNQSQERMELNIQRVIQRNNGKLFIVLRNQAHTHPLHPDFLKYQQTLAYHHSRSPFYLLDKQRML